MIPSKRETIREWQIKLEFWLSHGEAHDLSNFFNVKFVYFARENQNRFEMGKSIFLRFDEATTYVKSWLKLT